MPVYEYHCNKGDREVTLTLTISQHEKGKLFRVSISSSRKAPSPGDP
jgi:hypothetical protein